MTNARPKTAPRLVLGALASLLALAACGADRPAARVGDPLAEEIARWSAFVAADTAGDAFSVSILRATTGALAQSRASLERGRRLHALLRLGAARTYLEALAFMREHPEAAASQEALEAEWKRSGAALLAEEPAAVAASLAGVRPAAVRAMGEAAIPAVRISYDASLEYGRATDAHSGLYYLGEAHAQRRMVELCRSLGEAAAAGAPAGAGAPPAAAEPAFRALGPEIEALQAEMLAVYRPPVSIDRHGEFIGASGALKEARELDAAGLPRGALLRYLQAVLRLQPMLAKPPAFDAVATPAKLGEFESRFAAAGLDHSIGRLFIETARWDLEDTSATATHASAAAIADVVLPRYLAALAPAKPRPAAPAPEVTVTLVRWPYT